MFRYISVFLSHYPPKRPAFPRDWGQQYSYKQVRAPVQSAYPWSGLLSCVCAVVYMLSPELCVSSYESQLFICVLHTLSRYCSQVVYPPQVHTVLIYGAVTFLYDNTLQSKHARIQYCLAAGWPCCVSGCVKGQVCVCVDFSFSQSFILFKVLYSAVPLLIPLLVSCFRVFCRPIAIH